MARLEPVIMELERQQNILVICHQVAIFLPFPIWVFVQFRYNYIFGGYQT